MVIHFLVIRFVLKYSPEDTNRKESGQVYLRPQVRRLVLRPPCPIRLTARTRTVVLTELTPLGFCIQLKHS